MEIGRKIYYGKSNGLIIWDKGEMSGSVRETTLEEDAQIMPVLLLIDQTELGIKQLEFGELSEQFQKCKGYRVNPETLEIEFAFPTESNMTI